MQFEWDDAKNQLNIRKHGIDFRDVKEMFNHPMFAMLDTREDYGEDRWLGIGLLRHHVAVVVYVERRHDIIRIISARKATQHEVKRYEQSIKN